VKKKSLTMKAWDRNNEIENHNSLKTEHLNIKADDSNKHTCFNQPWKMKALYIFEIATPVLSSKHQKLIQEV